MTRRFLDVGSSLRPPASLPVGMGPAIVVAAAGFPLDLGSTITGAALDTTGDIEVVKEAVIIEERESERG